VAFGLAWVLLRLARAPLELQTIPTEQPKARPRLEAV